MLCERRLVDVHQNRWRSDPVRQLGGPLDLKTASLQPSLLRAISMAKNCTLVAASREAVCQFVGGACLL